MGDKPTPPSSAAPCPTCGKSVHDYLWLFREQYYCTQEHVPQGSRATPRHQGGSIDWEAYYAHYGEGFYGVPPVSLGYGYNRGVDEERTA